MPLKKIVRENVADKQENSFSSPSRRSFHTELFRFIITSSCRIPATFVSISSKDISEGCFQMEWSEKWSQLSTNAAIDYDTTECLPQPLQQPRWWSSCHVILHYHHFSWMFRVSSLFAELSWKYVHSFHHQKNKFIID